MDLTVTDPIQLQVLTQAASRYQLDPAEYVPLQAIAAATTQLALGFDAVIALEQQHIDAGDYTTCGHEWDSGIKIHGEPVMVTCCRIATHATVAIAGRQSHAGYLPSGSLITIDTPA